MNTDSYRSIRMGVDVEEVSMGFRTVRLLAAVDLDDAQQGYGGGGWSSDWLVIAMEDELADPIFIDLASDRLPVFTAMHGNTVWERVRIADSFDAFVAGLRQIDAVSTGRATPIQLEANPTTDEERRKVLAEIARLSPESDIEFWKSWLTVE